MDLPEYLGESRIFLIATTQRCGSHFLGHALAACQHFGVPLEYLNGRNLIAWKKRFGANDFDDLLPALIRHRSGATGWFGVKAHWSQFHPFADGALFAPHGGVKCYIWIYRRDLLAQAISFLIAEQTGQWISSAPKQGKERYDYDSVVRRAEIIRAQNTSWSRFFQDPNHQPVMQIVYEELLADQPGTLAKVADFVDADAAMRPEASGSTKKQAGSLSANWRKLFVDQIRDRHRWILEPQDWRISG